MAQIVPFTVSDEGSPFVIIHMMGGDNNLSSFAREDLREMALGNMGRASVLALADYDGAPANVVEISPGGGEPRVLESLGEIDTGDPEVLATFLARALLTFPGARKAIGFWDHGTGVFDETDLSEKLLTRKIGSVDRGHRTRSRPARRLFFPKNRLKDDYVFRDLDITMSGSRARAMLHDDTNGGVLTNLEAGRMLEIAFRRAGQQEKVDLIFSDTCLNGMVEVLDEIGRFGQCFVASSDLEPGDGWDYREWLSRMSASPPATAADWSGLAVSSFELAYRDRRDQHPCTLGAFRTDHEITAAFAEVIRQARKEGMNGFAALDVARARSQSFDRRDTYDLKDFAKRVLETTSSEALRSAVIELQRSFDGARIQSCCLGEAVPDSNGLAFWFPGNRKSLRDVEKTYTRLTFNRRTNWIDYLREFR